MIEKDTPNREILGYYDIAKTCQIGGLGAIYQKYIGRIQHGAFVEVGAFDGISFSNTSCFEEHEWTGLLFEPLPKSFKLCQARYLDNPRIRVVQCCIGNRIGYVEIFPALPAEQLTTTSQEHIGVYKTMSWGSRAKMFSPERSFMSPVLTLDFALSIFGWQPDFEVLVIDTEGTELQVLGGFNITNWRPKLVIVECHELQKHELMRRNAPAINAYFEQYGYEKVYADKINSIFVNSI